MKSQIVISLQILVSVITLFNIFCIHLHHRENMDGSYSRPPWKSFGKLGLLCLKGPTRNWQPAQDCRESGAVVSRGVKARKICKKFTQQVDALLLVSLAEVLVRE